MRGTMKRRKDMTGLPDHEVRDRKRLPRQRRDRVQDRPPRQTDAQHLVRYCRLPFYYHAS